MIADDPAPRAIGASGPTGGETYPALERSDGVKCPTAGSDTAHAPRAAASADGATTTAVRFGRVAGERVWLSRRTDAPKFLERVRRASRAEASVLITGETGTGKELVAQMLHFLGPRAALPFVAQNCAALPDTLLESELFGFRKGAFTGAGHDKEGLMEAAHGGTLFLDEIGDMPTNTQAKILRVLENREIRRLGDVRVRAIDVRFVAATNVGLRQRVEEGTFRRDLFYRLNVIRFDIPPLRERQEDIPELAYHFLRSGPTHMRNGVITPGAMRRLLAHSWPGNLRELRNVIEAVSVLCDGTTVDEGDVVEALDADLDATLCPAPRDIQQLRREIERVSKNRVVDALREAKGNKARAAQICGCSRGALYYALRKYNLLSA
jgi:transcriptional regulator with PAS, ATPase and Fis domain